MAEILPTHTPALFAAAVARAAELLRAGEVVALPTETVYGLAAHAFDERAVARIFTIKGRPAHNPIIVHVADRVLARRCVRAWPAPAERLAAAFWPGPLTLVLPRASDLPGIVTAGGDTVGVRWPSHPFMQAVIRACGFPLAAPSANPANALSPTSAEHVARALGSHLSLIVDGGPCQVGLESTVLDLTATPPRVLRPGMIHAASLLAVLGEPPGLSGSVLAPDSAPTDTALRSPGQLPKHYSPQATLHVLSWADESSLHAELTRVGVSAVRCHILAHSIIPSGLGLASVSVIPHDAEAFARALYAELHRCDEAGVRHIIVEAPPETAAWQAIWDRLRRAAAPAPG